MGQGVIMKLVLKTDENGNAVVVEGKIIYVDEDNDGKEYPLDPPQLYSKVADLGKENKKRREKIAEVEAKYLAFADIEDVEEWKKSADEAIATVANFNDKDFLEAGKVEKMKSEMKDAYEKQLGQKDEKIKALNTKHAEDLSAKDSQIRTLMVSNRFSTSPYFNGEESVTTMPPDVAEAFFGKHFKVENIDGDLTLRAYFGNDEITSEINPGDPADFEEAIGIIIDKYPNKDHILRAPGGGSGGSGGGGGGSTPTDELKKLKQQLEEAQKGGKFNEAIALKNMIFKLEQGKKAS